MGSSKSSGQLKAPDPGQVSQQQTASNIGTAVTSSYLNNVNQVTPYGTQTHDVTGNYWDANGNWVPRWTTTTKLSPEQQKLYDTQTKVTQGAYDLADQYTGRIADATSTPFNYEGLPAAPEYNDAYRQQQREAIIARNQPQMDQDRAALEQRLANQGISVGTDAWKDSFYDYNRAVNDYRLGADIQSGTAAAQQFGLEGATRDRAIQERANLRTQPINEVGALLGTGQGVQNPSFVPTNNYQITPTDTSGNVWNAYQAQIAQQQAGQRGSNAALGGLFGLAGTLGGAYLGGPFGASLGGAAGRGLGGPGGG